MKCTADTVDKVFSRVALFTRAWIEIIKRGIVAERRIVALFTRAWIEMPKR